MSEFFNVSTEQSQIKAAIVSKYFWAWANVIMAVQRSDRIAYLDLFAGPGRYKDGNALTPLLILQEAIQDDKMRDRLVATFNDKDEDSSRTLENAINALPGIERLKYKPRVLNREVGTDMVKIFEQGRFVPTLFFVDPWGYRGLSLQLVNAVVKDWACECIFFFNYNRVNMGLGNDDVREHMDALFGPAHAAKLREQLEPLAAEDRELTIVDALTRALNPTGNRFVLPFRFRRLSGRTSHHLIHVSKSFRGYDIMKGVMSRESSGTEQKVATFEYSPADERYPLLFELNRPLDELEGMLLKEFGGKTIPFEKLYETHSVGQRYIKRNYKELLLKLEKAGRISAVKTDGKKRIQGKFPDDLLVTFRN